MSKGSKQRPRQIDEKTFNERWDAIFQHAREQAREEVETMKQRVAEYVGERNDG